MTTAGLSFKTVHESWKNYLKLGLSKMDPAYLDHLNKTSDWLPGHEKIFNAFSLPLNQVNYVLFGESPYPRLASANGYAFWDEAVTDLWSPSGLSKRVNRATSLRHFMKMLLVAEGMLSKSHHSQDDIAKLNKKNLIETNQELFHNFLDRGFLLLNASLVLQDQAVTKDAKAWYPFMQTIITSLLKERPNVTLVLLGKIANKINLLTSGQPVHTLITEHPYNMSFVTNDIALSFFKPLHLLRK